MAASFAAALSLHSEPAEALGEAVGEVLEQLGHDPLDLAVVFVSPHHVGALEDMAGAIRSFLRPRVLIGCTTVTVVGGGREAEDTPGVSLFAARLPGVELTPMHLWVDPTPDGPALVGWPEDLQPGGTVIALADPFTFPGEVFLERVNRHLPGTVVIGGLASAGRGPGGNRLALDDRVTAEGAVGVLVRGELEVSTVVSQGCRPVGRPYTVTRAEGHVIFELGGRPALERLAATLESLSPEERQLVHQGLHIGRVVDEHRSEFRRGDFLVRNVMGIDRSSGAIAVGDLIEVGQTVQFHVRDASSAHEDLRELLSGTEADAALLFTCNGRGRHLFGVPDHDAGLVDKLLGPLPLAGMFCAGELGPVGGRNFLHGFTASLALLKA